MKSLFKRRLLLLFSFVFAGAIAYGVFWLSPKTGKLNPQEYFCPTCLNQFILKNSVLQIPNEIQFLEDSLFFYIPAQLELSEKAGILSVLQDIRQLGPVGSQIFESWGKSRLSIKIRFVEHGIFHPQKKIQWPLVNSWPLFYFSSLQTLTSQNEDMAMILIHPMQTEFDVFLSLSHQLFYLFDPADYSVIENPHLQKALRSFRALLVELQMYERYTEKFPKKKVSQYRSRIFHKFLKKIKKRDYATLFEWVLEQLYPSDWTKEILTEDIKARVFQAGPTLTSLGDLAVPYTPKDSVSFVGRLLPRLVADDSGISTAKFSEFFSMQSTATGLILELRPQNNYSADNSPALIGFSGIRKEILEFMRTSLGESQNDDRAEIINSYIKGSLPQMLNFSEPMFNTIRPGLKEEF